MRTRCARDGGRRNIERHRLQNGRTRDRHSHDHWLRDRDWQELRDGRRGLEQVDQADRAEGGEEVPTEAATRFGSARGASGAIFLSGV